MGDIADQLIDFHAGLADESCYRPRSRRKKRKQPPKGVYKVRIHAYSLKKDEIGKPVEREVIIREHASAKAALIDIEQAIVNDEGRQNPAENGTYHIVMPDGRQLPMVAAYREVFGEEPKRKASGEYSFPRLK